MDIMLRYWNEDENVAETRYLTSGFLGGAKAEDVLEKFEKFEIRIQKINDSGKLLQIGSDGPSVNLKFLKMYDEKHSFDEYPDILNIGSCGLHTIHKS